MFVFRSFFGVTLLAFACAEECAVSEGSSLMQTKQQRQKTRKKEDDELVTSLMARANGRQGLDSERTLMERAVSGKDWRDVIDLERVLMRKVTGTCDEPRKQKSRGKQHFGDEAQVSKITGTPYQLADEQEFAVLDKINEVRQAGFTCTEPETSKNPGKVHTFTPKCRNEDLIFDCRLWFAAKQHSEDMGKRNYYAHETQAPFPSGKTYGDGIERFNKRAAAYSFGVPVHKEVLMGANGDEDTPEVIVNSWLGSFAHCMALGTKNAEVAGIGRAPCENPPCVHDIGMFTTGLLQQRGFLQFDSWITALDTSCYPESRNKSSR